MATAGVSHQSLIAIFLDVEKAFDMTWHTGIFRKLHALGLRGNFLIFIRNFLANSTFQVKIGYTLSGKFHLQNGVPQGSILSPTQFSIIINNFLSTAPQSLNYSLYADVYALWGSAQDFWVVERRVENGLQGAQGWALQWGFKFSPQTSKGLFISKHSRYTLPL